LIGDDGRFRLEVPSDTERLYLLEAGSQRLPIFLEPGIHQLQADFRQLYTSARYSNSPLTDLMLSVEKKRMDFEQIAQDLEQRFSRAQEHGNQKSADSALKAFDGLQQRSKLFVKNFIDSLGPNPVSHLAVSMLSVEDDFQFLDSLLTRFEKEKPKAAYTKKMQSFLEAPRRLAIGKQAPEILVSDPNGKQVKLSQFRGKWVLLDFWASWCKPCIGELPFLSDVQKRFGPKGFTVFSISVDENPKDWQKAMVTYRMHWAHGRDFSQGTSQSAQVYAVSSLPSTYLIDPSGKIVAKNLRGPALRQKLESVIE
jgi:peroxiredoxin